VSINIEVTRSSIGGARGTGIEREHRANLVSAFSHSDQAPVAVLSLRSERLVPEGNSIVLRDWPAGDITTTLRGVMENLGSTSFETALARVRESLQLAMS
jgi:hypothetical protein